jgi:hypothetical protein
MIRVPPQGPGGRDLSQLHGPDSLSLSPDSFFPLIIPKLCIIRVSRPGGAGAVQNQDKPELP